MIYMLTFTEVNFLKELLEQLASVADISDYTEQEVEEALEILNKVKPINIKDYFNGEYKNDR